MPLQRSHTADKIIVDRRKRHRNSDVARAVRKTRDQLAQQPGGLAFDRELLKLHAASIRANSAALPLLVVILAGIGLLLGAERVILTWAFVAILAYGGLALLARRADEAAPAAMSPMAMRRTFLVGHFVTGLAWAYLAAMTCTACEPDLLAILKGAFLLVAMAATAFVASSLRGAMTATFFVPVAAYAAFGVRLSEPLGMIMVTLLVVALPFFSQVANIKNRSALMLMSFRSEMDALIAELETAKSMSDEARRRAEDANLAKSRFLATMSHELRTPLNAILGFSEVMAGEVLGPINSPTYREYSRDIHDSGKHLLDLINEILDLSRIEAGRYQLNEEPLALLTVVEDCCHMMELKARNKDLRIVEQFEPALPRLLGDERAVRQITLNLLSNAIKFSPTGGEIRVRVGWTAGGGQYISVKDNGPGIPAEEIPIVLSAFGQGSIAIKSAEQGTGLGLPIVQGLLSLHGGEFELHSKLREGTEAIAIFPAARVIDGLPKLEPRSAARA
ncbi:HAMP domain-containing sensor histidine kinase [Aminobacter sp. AP02]|uniref:sensor histidine kinase n=1 Tax=Aminobacter sp. AP02 TaxID=2135737 RepID=UPI000D6B4D2F|nr:HAMP domain-containing sensor histidine kinase [Aminobacter sp. AP02]PWK69916.1 two-component system cell cycle sensor histidine kinase PleC [Aminobacter sp. AP02]